MINIHTSKQQSMEHLSNESASQQEEKYDSELKQLDREIIEKKNLVANLERQYMILKNRNKKHVHKIENYC